MGGIVDRATYALCDLRSRDGRPLRWEVGADGERDLAILWENLPHFGRHASDRSNRTDTLMGLPVLYTKHPGGIFLYALDRGSEELLIAV